MSLKAQAWLPLVTAVEDAVYCVGHSK